MPSDPKTHTYYSFPIRREELDAVRQVADCLPGISIAAIIRAGIRLAIAKIEADGTAWLEVA